MSYPADQASSVDIRSKYGEVIVRTWQYDSVKFEVVVRAEGKNDDVVRKSMSKVDVRFRKVGNIISAVTEISSSGGFFGGLSSQLGNVMGGNKLNIDFQIWLPSDVLLSVENKYGDVYLTDLNGSVELDVSHGDIKAGDFEGDLNLKHGYGKSSFRSISNAMISLRGAEFHCDTAGFLDFESGSSEIRIDQVDKVNFNSRNDKIRLLNATDVSCDGSFTDINIDYLTNKASLDFSYGDIYLAKIQRDFNRVSITGKSTDINLILNQASFIRTSIKGPEDKMVLPNSMLTLRKENFEEDSTISLIGDVGPPNSFSSSLDILADGGELVISIKETPLFSERD